MRRLAIEVECIAYPDPEPAHAQIATNRTAYILLKLIKDGEIEGNEALLNFSYDLIELASEQGMSIGPRHRIYL